MIAQVKIQQYRGADNSLARHN